MGGNQWKEQHREAWGHEGVAKATFRSQENVQKLEIKIHQMVKANIAKMMPKSTWKWGKDCLRQEASLARPATHIISG